MIIATMNEAGVAENRLLPAEQVTLFATLSDQFGIDFFNARWPWETVTDKSVVRDPDAWALISDFVGDRHCLMFADDRESVWRFQNGADLLRVLSEAPLFEFYVCDRDVTFLLCHNHHDCLIGWGTAKQWVDEVGSA